MATFPLPGLPLMLALAVLRGPTRFGPYICNPTCLRTAPSHAANMPRCIGFPHCLSPACCVALRRGGRQGPHLRPRDKEGKTLYIYTYRLIIPKAHTGDCLECVCKASCVRACVRAAASTGSAAARTHARRAKRCGAQPPSAQCSRCAKW